MSLDKKMLFLLTQLKRYGIMDNLYYLLIKVSPRWFIFYCFDIPRQDILIVGDLNSDVYEKMFNILLFSAIKILDATFLCWGYVGRN